MLKVLFEAFDDAWAEVGPSVGTEPSRVEMARVSLAEIVLAPAKADPVSGRDLRRAAVSAFRTKHLLK